MPAAPLPPGESSYRVDDLVIDAGRGRVTRDGAEISLSPLSFELLLALVRAAPDLVSLDKLMKEVWPQTVVSAETVSQRVKLVRDALGDDAASPRYIAGVRGRGYRLVASVSPVIQTETTDPGATPRGPAPKPKTRRPGAYRALVPFALLLLVFGLATTWWVVQRHRTNTPGFHNTAPARSIAVLPFLNLSADRTNAYLADGIQDEILTRLANLGGLKVISRTSASRYDSRPEDLKQVARELGVSAVLEGSVQKAADEIRVNVQLIDAATDSHIWAQDYDRSLKNVFQVESDIAGQVAHALQVKLEPGEARRMSSRPTTNPAAYDAYLRGVAVEAGQSSYLPLQLHAAQAFRKAVTLDPTFALAWARLADILSLTYQNWNHSRKQARAVKAARDKAVALAPDSGETWLTVGNYAYRVRHDYGQALIAYRKAASKLPNSAEAFAELSYVERRQGHWQRAIDSGNRAIDLDPRNLSIVSQTALTYNALRRFPKALELVNRGLLISPGDVGLRIVKTEIYMAQGDFPRAGKVLKTMPVAAAVPPIILYGAQYHLCTRDYDGAIAWLKKALAVKVPELMVNFARGMYEEQLGFAEQLAGNKPTAMAAYNRAKQLLQKRIAKQPNDETAYAYLGLAEAGLGEKSDALAAGRHAVALDPADADAIKGPSIEAYLAAIESQTGDIDEAIATVRRLLATPYMSSDGFGPLTPEYLKADPVWAPLRKDPRFQALLKSS